MKRQVRASAAVWSLFVIVNFTACLPGDRAWFSRAEAIKHFDTNRAEFGRIASDWLRDHLNDSFYYRPWANDVRWNSTVIGLPVKSEKVKVMQGTSTEFVSFDMAAKTAGVSPSTLQDWISRARRLGIAGVAIIGTRRSEQDRYLEIDLQEGGVRYGYVFIPSGHNSPLPKTDANSKQQLFDYVQELGGGWYYFESK